MPNKPMDCLLLTHYYHQAKRPFQSLSALSDYEALELMIPH